MAAQKFHHFESADQAIKTVTRRIKITIEAGIDPTIVLYENQTIIDKVSSFGPNEEKEFGEFLEGCLSFKEAASKSGGRARPKAPPVGGGRLEEQPGWAFL
jgi:hypothetical protein